MYTLDIANPSWWKLRNHPRILRILRELHPSWRRTRRDVGPHSWTLAHRAISRGALHKQCELARVIALAKKLCPRAVLEIGLSVGGTFEIWPLLVPEGGTIVGVDLSVPEPLRTFASTQTSKRVICIEGDSHSPAVLEEVRSMFPDGIDLLFIDGDHSYHGVKLDHVMYGPLVRTGGVILFHDIIPDHQERFGHRCLEYSGEVYRYWEQVRGAAYTVEYIEDPTQSGYGIGVVLV